MCSAPPETAEQGGALCAPADEAAGALLAMGCCWVCTTSCFGVIVRCCCEFAEAAVSLLAANAVLTWTGGDGTAASPAAAGRGQQLQEGYKLAPWASVILAGAGTCWFGGPRAADLGVCPKFGCPACVLKAAITM